MGDEGEPDAVVADVDVGVVAGFLGEFADAVHELKGGDEILELEGADELAGFNLPAGQLGDAGLSGFGGKDRHVDLGGWWLVVSFQFPGLKPAGFCGVLFVGLKPHVPSAVSIARCGWNLKLDACESVKAPGCGQVDLIQRNLFVVLGIEIGENLCGH